MSEDKAPKETTKEPKAKKISQKVAEDQFETFLDYYELSFSDIEIEDGKEAAATMRNTMIRAIRNERLVIDVTEKGLEITQVLKFATEHNDSITYRDKTVKANLAMDKITGKGKSTEKAHAFMSALAGVPAVEFLNLRGPDATIFSRIWTVFSMV